MFSILENKVFAPIYLQNLRASFVESNFFFVCVAVELQPNAKDEYLCPQWVSNQRSSQAAADPRLLPHGHRDRSSLYLLHVIKN